MRFLVQSSLRGRNALAINQGSHEENQMCIFPQSATVFQALPSMVSFFVPAVRVAREGKGKTQSSRANSKSSHRIVALRAYNDKGPRARGWAARPGGRVLPSSPYP